MILRPNQTSQSYKEEITKGIPTAILNECYEAFLNLKEKFKQLQLQG